MYSHPSLLVIGTLALAGFAGAQQPAAPVASTAGPESGKICKYVVDDRPGSKPQQLCLTKTEWDAKALADAKDATRIVCKYQDVPGSRFRSAKVCMPAAQWDEARRLDREAVEQIQRNVCVSGGGC